LSISVSGEIDNDIVFGIVCDGHDDALQALRRRHLAIGRNRATDARRLWMDRMSTSTADEIFALAWAADRRWDDSASALSLSSPTGKLGVTCGLEDGLGKPSSMGGRFWLGVGGGGVDSGPAESLERALDPEAPT
jgi:hypothetical protein